MKKIIFTKTKSNIVYWGEKSLNYVRDFYQEELRAISQKIDASKTVTQYWEKMLEDTTEKLKNIQEGTEEEFYHIESEIWLTETKETSEDVFNEMFECLPPKKVISFNDGFTFFMSEFNYGTFTNQYLKKGNKFYYASVDYADNSTWIHNRNRKEF